MRKALKRKIKRIIIIILIGVIIGVGFTIYHTLGPLRSFFWNAPYLMGFLGSREYLIILQNNNELRPTGGFITALGKAEASFGFTSIDVLDSYQIPNPTPRLPAPEPFEYFIGKNDNFFAGWTFRDGNFSPDFRKSSQDLIQLYQNAYPDSRIDAVFAVDFQVIEALIDLYGPFIVDDTEIRSDNFFEISQKRSKNIDTHDVEALRTRKDFFKPLIQELKSRIFKSPGKYARFFKLLAGMGKQKHLLAYSASPGLQYKFERHELSNVITNSEAGSDFIHVNIANIGGRKADRYVMKNILYRADFSNPMDPHSILEINLEHLGSYNIQSDIYQAYIRVYVPQGSKLITSSGTMLRATQEFSDLNLTVFADYIRIRPGERITLRYKYSLPEQIIAGDYRLQILKQPGVQDQWWQVAIKQVNDSNMQNTAYREDTLPLTIRENLALYQGELKTDISFHVVKKADRIGPIILWQKFVDLNTINVRFNELLDKTSALNLNNYQIYDLDKKNTVTDNITITNASFDERDLWLKVRGVTLQNEEQYELIFRDITDINSNLITPNPSTRTLVQRITPNL